MDAVEYIKELGRMCQYYIDRKKCDISCPFDFFCQNTRDEDAKKAEAMVNAVENWREEHPVITNGQKVMELINSSCTNHGHIWNGAGTPEGVVQIRVDADWWQSEYRGE